MACGRWLSWDFDAGGVPMIFKLGKNADEVHGEEMDS
jgi:hypothetical protein